MTSAHILFVGGVSGTKKTEIIDRVCGRNGTYRHLRISDHYMSAIDQGGNNPDSLIQTEWKQFEDEAIDGVTKAIREWLANDEDIDVIIVNTHFASKSERGFMFGTDPTGLKRIVESARVDQTADRRAGVVLLDSSPRAIIANQNMVKPTLNAQRDIEDDLDQNRSKSMDYYHSLVGLIGADRVGYASILAAPNDKKFDATDLKALEKDLEAKISNIIHKATRKP